MSYPTRQKKIFGEALELLELERVVIQRVSGDDERVHAATLPALLVLVRTDVAGASDIARIAVEIGGDAPG